MVIRAQPFARAQWNSGWTSIPCTQPCMKRPFSLLNMRCANCMTCFTPSSKYLRSPVSAPICASAGTLM